MPREKNIPKTVIDYNKLSDEMKQLYNKIFYEFNQKNIFGLRDQAVAMQVESPTTLNKKALVRRMTDKIMCEYLPNGGKDVLMDVAERELAMRKHGMFCYDAGGDGRVDDIFVPPAIIREADLRVGDVVDGLVADSGKGRALIFVDKIEDGPIRKSRRCFDTIAITPRRLFDKRNGRTANIFISDIQMGERVIYSGMTLEIARDLADSFVCGVLLMVGLPMEAYMPKGFIASFDMSHDETIRVARLALGRAKRLAEDGNDAVLVVFGADTIDDTDTQKAIFGAGRCFESGSLTVITDLSKDRKNGLFAKVATRII